MLGILLTCFDRSARLSPASYFAPERANPLSDEELNKSGKVYAQTVPPEKVNFTLVWCRREPSMRETTEPVVCQFYRLIPDAPLPRRADRSADGTLPVNAYRYCEAIASALWRS